MHLGDEFKILVGRTLQKYVPELDWLNKYVPDHISHKYTKGTTIKSEIVINYLLYTAAYLYPCKFEEKGSNL